jgi:DNA replication protein DnaC
MDAKPNSSNGSRSKPTKVNSFAKIAERWSRPLSAEEQAAAAEQDRLRQQRERAMQEQAAVGKLLDDVGRRYHAATLDTFEVYHPAQKSVIARLRKVADEMPASVKDGRGLVLAGPAGAGKDFLAAAMAIDAGRRHLIQSRQLNVRELGIATWERAEGLIEEMSWPPLLILSDPSGNALEIERLITLLDARYKRMLSTWLTANAQDEAALIELLGPSITGRFVEDAEVVWCLWPDYRMRAARRGAQQTMTAADK